LKIQAGGFLYFYQKRANEGEHVADLGSPARELQKPLSRPVDAGESMRLTRVNCRLTFVMNRYTEMSATRFKDFWRD
jgi:hypothetical protein